MNEQVFLTFLKRNKKSERTILRYLACVRNFEAYLVQKGKTLDDCQPDDLRQGAQSEVGRSFNDFLGIAAYYEFTGNEQMWLTAHELFSAENFDAFALKEFLGVNMDHIERLKRRGITTAKHMLEAGRTPADRAMLALETGIPGNAILELVKLSDQARIGGHRRARTRLYHEAGFDTLDKIAAVEPEKLRQKLAEFIEKSGFEGIAPTPKEAAHSVALARHLPRLVVY